jgi:hypothetical protein
MNLARALFLAGIVAFWSEPVLAQSKVELHSTDRLPGANGAAEIRSQSGLTRIDIEVDDMKPAALFGGDYATYVFWLVAPDGQASNLGEFQLIGDESSLSVSTSLEKFAMIVTAEPHYLVSAPSRFVVMEDAPLGTPVEYRGHDGYYNYQRDTLAGMSEAESRVRTDVRQAFSAVRLAQRSGAGELAKIEMAAADDALDLTLTLSQQGLDRHATELQARATVRLAVAAQRKAREEEIAQMTRANREAQETAKRSAAKK